MSDVYSAMSLLPPINIEVANDKRRRLVDHYHEELGDLRLLQWLDLVEGYEPDYAYLPMFVQNDASTSVRNAIYHRTFFSYSGYFQLMAAVDVFVFYDDVAYIKGGWIARDVQASVPGPRFTRSRPSRILRNCANASSKPTVTATVLKT